jgi:hypothetical protein
MIELICLEPDVASPKWGEGFRVAIELLDEARVTVRFVEALS